jgi:glycosyltransferase involved in cell wall biosynthesis
VEKTVEHVIKTVLAIPLVGEEVVVNDSSKDGTAEIVKRLAAVVPRLSLYNHDMNQGKGAIK